MITRRGLLAGILAAGVAPIVLPRSSIMGLWVPRRVLAPPDKLYVGLFTADGREVNGNGYARQPHRPGESIEFPPVTGNWGTITHAMVAGVLIPLDRYKTVLTGDNLSLRLHDTPFTYE